MSITVYGIDSEGISFLRDGRCARLSWHEVREAHGLTESEARFLGQYEPGQS